MQLVRTWLGMLSIASLPLLVGCNVEDDSVDEGVAESTGEAGTIEGEDVNTAEQMFAAFGYSSATATSGNAGTILGTWSGNAAYLMGVTGNLSNGGNVAMQKLGTDARVFAHAGNGYSVRAYGGLANPGTVSGEYGYSNNSYVTSSADVPLGTSTGNRRCFLTQVINYDTTDNFNNPADYIGIKPGPGNTWVLWGQGKVAGFARCVVVTTPLGEAYWGGAGSQNLGGPVTGKTCWLRGIGGILRGSTSTGVVIQYDGTQTRWEMNTSANTAGYVECNI